MRGSLVICAVLYLTSMALCQVPTTQPDQQDKPVICLWDGGIYLAGLKPQPLFVAWSDGTVACRVTAEGKVDLVAHGEALALRTGSVTRAELQQALATIEKAGFFQPPLGRGMLSADGPSQRLYVRQGKAARAMEHTGHSTQDWRDSIGKQSPSASPSPGDSLALLQMWDGILDAIGGLKPTMQGEFHGGRSLEAPRIDEPTDAAGNPCIEYVGTMEQKEQMTYGPDGRGRVCMSKVGVVDAARYKALIAAKVVRDEERHGQWRYFSVDEPEVRPAGNGVTQWLSYTHR